MSSRMNGPGFYEFLIEAELQQYYNAFKNDLKVQNVSQLKYVSEDDMGQIGMSRPEMRRLTKYFHKHCPQTYLAKMKKKLLYRREDAISVASLSNSSQNIPGRSIRSVSAPGRHIIQADAIVSHKTLGSGEFGTVQQGVWTSDDGERIQVAIKSLSQDRMENNPVEFLKEAAIMHTVDHEHIVRLYGVVLDMQSLVLVTELAPLRSLLECLKEPSMRVYLTLGTLFDFCIQICDGMQYLESKRLIHRDLAARNILVFSRTKVKISDFGLSRALGVGKDYYQTNFNVNLKLPIAWCAPESIAFLRFTSASDVWAFGVTLWEMFSYGFQPWAALTGQQILEAIDEPNYQRLEKPECCPNEMYYQIMLKCWQHEPHDRPTFVQLLNMLPECKPEQLQAIRESDSRSRRDLLLYDAGDIITVLDKKPLLPGGSNASSSSGDESTLLWKGVLKFGKSGLFSPVNTITYLGSSLPSLNQAQNPFSRNDSRSSSMRKGRISADMISAPQNDLKHTGHIGSDGNFFGDIAFLNSKCWVPRQVVPPYKPESPNPDTSEGSSSSSRFHLHLKGYGDSHSEIPSSDTAPLLSTASQMNTDSSSQRNRRRLVLPTGSSISPVDIDTDHEYHEISDEENEIMASSRSGRNGAIGLSNPALNSESQSPLESPRFDKTFDLGPSLVDEVFGALRREEQQPDEANVKNEMREMARQRKKFATVKPISSSDRKTLDHAIAIANELASRSMQDLDRHGKHGNNSFDDISSPRTPNSPTHRKKFSFMLGSGKNSERERRNYSQEAASIPDIQSTLSEEAKEAYNSLIDKPSLGSLGFLTPSFENKSSSFHFPEKSLSKKSDFFDNEPLSPPPPSSAIFQNQIASSPTANNPVASTSRNLPPVSHSRTLSSRTETEDEDVNEVEYEEEEVDANPLRLLRMNKVPNVLPLPPRERKKPNTVPSSRSSSSSYSNPSRHQRKHPLLIPGRVSIPSEISTRAPPPPPPKPQRQITISTKQLAQPETPVEKKSEKTESILGTSITDEEVLVSPKSDQVSVDSSVYEHRSSASFSVSELSIPLYENYETEPIALESTEISRNSQAEGLDNELQLQEPSDKPENQETVVTPIVVDERRSVDFMEKRRNFESRAMAEAEEMRPVPKLRSQIPMPQAESPVRDRELLRLSIEKEVSPPQHQEDQAFGYQHSIIRSKDSNFVKEQVTVPEKTSPVKETATFGFIPPREIESVSLSRGSASGFSNRMSPSKDTPVNLSPMKIKTVQRILGSSATEQECVWALDISNGDSAHAVKLLRLKALLPDALLYEDIGRVVSVLEMSHWDVARASTFLLSNSQPSNSNSNRSSLRKSAKSDFLNANSTSGNGDSTATNSSRSSVVSIDNVQIASDLANSNPSTGSNSSAEGQQCGRDYIRPTRV